MANLTPSTIRSLKGDRYQVYVAPKVGAFTLAQGLQSTDISIDCPIEVIDELGNTEHRGMSADIPTVTFSLEGLNTDLSLVQAYSNKLGATTTPVATSTEMDEALDVSGAITATKVYMRVVGPLKKSGCFLLVADAEAALPTYHVDISGIALFASTLQIGKTYQLSGAYVQNIELSVDLALSGIMQELSSTTVGFNCENNWDTDELKDAEVDVLLVARDNATSSDPKGKIFKNIYIDGAVLKSLTANADATGNATESFANETELLTYGDGYYLRKSYIFNDANATEKNMLNIETFGILVSGIENPVVGKTLGSYLNKYFRKVTVLKAGGTSYELTENTTSGDFAATISGLDKYYNYKEGEAIRELHLSNDMVAGDRIEMTFFTKLQDSRNNTGVSGFATEFSTARAAVKGRYIPVRFGNSGVHSALDTAQSVSLTVNFTRDRINALGAGDTLNYAPSAVPEITGDINTLASDMSLIDLLTEGTSTSSNYEFSAAEIADRGVNNSVAVQVRLLDPADSTTEFKKYELSAVTVNKVSEGISVGGSATQNFSFTSKDGLLNIFR
jgi:hypothetical protein